MQEVLTSSRSLTVLTSPTDNFVAVLHKIFNVHWTKHMYGPTPLTWQCYAFESLISVFHYSEHLKYYVELYCSYLYLGHLGTFDHPADVTISNCKRD
jgi:hypothetical protein